MMRSVITVPCCTAVSKAAGRSALPRREPFMSGIARRTNSSPAPRSLIPRSQGILDRTLHRGDRGPEAIDDLGELLVGGHVGRREERLIPREAVDLRVRRGHEEPVLERRVVD